MDTILSFTIVVLFSGWIFRLKTEISTLERLVGIGEHAATPFSPAHTESAPLQTGSVYDRTARPAAASKAAPAASAPSADKASRKGGVQVWTIDG